MMRCVFGKYYVEAGLTRRGRFEVGKTKRQEHQFAFT